MDILKGFGGLFLRGYKLNYFLKKCYIGMLEFLKYGFFGRVCIII